MVNLSFWIIFGFRLLNSTFILMQQARYSLGYGAVFGAHWFFGQWPHSWLGRNIIVLEMFPIVISVSIWASELANKCILFHTDNQGPVEIINRKTTKDRQLLVLLRELVNIIFCFGPFTCLGCLMSKLMLYRAYRSRDSSPSARIWIMPKRQCQPIFYHRTGLCNKAPIICQFV